MSRSIFGSSYPPCCSGPPDDGYAPSELVDSVLGLLEDADVEQDVCDKIVTMIEDWERKKWGAQEPEILPPEDDGGF